MAGQNQVHTAGAPAVEAARDLARLTSLDAFRGLVILTMIFVNFLAGVSGIPPWAKHMPGKVDGYTFVDLVFPGFLFIVGVAIPLAQQNRRRRGDSPARLLGHIASRTAGLLFLGVILVNEETFSSQATGMSRSVWFLLALHRLCDQPCRRPAPTALRKRASSILSTLNGDTADYRR